MNYHIKDVAIGFGSGALVILIAPYLIGYTSAIAIPASLMDFFRGTSITLGMYTWEILIVQFLGAGILALGITIVANQFVAKQLPFALSFIFVVFAASVAYLLLLVPESNVLSAMSNSIFQVGTIGTTVVITLYFQSRNKA
jgi:hypothetical protein